MSHPALPVLATTGSGASKRGSHQLAAVFQCGRKWHLRYRKRVVPREDVEHRMAGTLGHLSVAYAYVDRIREQDKWPMPTWWEDEPLLDALAREGEGWPQLIPTANALYSAYSNLVMPYEKHVEPIAVEEQFFAKLGDVLPDCPEHLKDEVFTSAIDLVYRDTRTGMIWVRDHKSKGFDWFSRGPQQRMTKWDKDGEQYNIHWQALVNLLIVRNAFPQHTVAGFEINRFTRKMTKGGAFLFDCHKLDISPRVYASTPEVVRRCIEEELRIDALVAAGEQPSPNFWACDGKYGNCDYINLCRATDIDAVLERDFMVAA